MKTSPNPSPATDLLTSAVASSTERLARERARLATLPRLLKAAQRLVAPRLAQIPDNVFDRRLDLPNAPYVTLDLCPGTWNNTVYLTLTLENASGLNAEESLAVLEPFADLPAEPTRDSQYSSGVCRYYEFTLQSETGKTPVRLVITVGINVRPDSPTCRKVLVGQELVTRVEPRYEVVCE